MVFVDWEKASHPRVAVTHLRAEIILHWAELIVIRLIGEKHVEAWKISDGFKTMTSGCT